MTEEELDALMTELYAIDYSDDLWTAEALERRAEIAKILDAAGRF